MNITKLEGELIADFMVWASTRFSLFSLTYIPNIREWSFYGIDSHLHTTYAPLTINERNSSIYDLYAKVTGREVEIDL